MPAVPWVSFSICAGKKPKEDQNDHRASALSPCALRLSYCHGNVYHNWILKNTKPSPYSYHNQVKSIHIHFYGPEVHSQGRGRITTFDSMITVAWLEASKYLLTSLGSDEPPQTCSYQTT